MKIPLIVNGVVLLGFLYVLPSLELDLVGCLFVASMILAIGGTVAVIRNLAFGRPLTAVGAFVALLATILL